MKSLNNIFGLNIQRLFNKQYLIKANKLNLFIFIITILGSIYLLYIIIKYVYMYFHNKPSTVIDKPSKNINWLIDARHKLHIPDVLPPNINKPIPSGFKGGGKGYNSKYGSMEYKQILLQGNHTRDSEGTRMLRGWWPEFNWYLDVKNYTNKVYATLYNDISRLLYNDKGEILSIICPQLGLCIPKLGCIKIEITVDKIKGWFNESNKTCEGELQGFLQIWIETKNHKNHIMLNNQLPFTKEKSIKIPVYSDQSLTNRNIRFYNNNKIEPNLHPNAWMKIQINNVYVGNMDTSNINNITKFSNKILIELLNIHSANLLKQKNIINWVIYLSKPELVNKKEYLQHVEDMKYSFNHIYSPYNVYRPKNTTIIKENGEIYKALL